MDFANDCASGEGERSAAAGAGACERVNLPDFGSGLLQLPFAPNSMEMAAATQFSVQGALQKWLSGQIKVQSVVATSVDSALTVTVTYTPLNTGISQVQTFVYGGTQ